VTDAVRPALWRLRDGPLPPPGRIRRTVAVAVVIGLHEVAFQVGIALSPRHGGGRLIGLFASYAVAFLLLQAIPPRGARPLGTRRLPPELGSDCRRSPPPWAFALPAP
jgi:hypothetical protein